MWTSTLSKAGSACSTCTRVWIERSSCAAAGCTATGPNTDATMVATSRTTIPTRLPTFTRRIVFCMLPSPPRPGWGQSLVGSNRPTRSHLLGTSARTFARRGATASCRGRRQRLFQCLLLLGGEVGADDGAAELGHLRQDPLLVGVARHHKERRATRLDRARDLLDPLVVHAVIAQVSGKGTGCRADRHPGNGDQEEQAEDEAPHRPTRGTGAGQVRALMQLHLAILGLGDPGDVLQLDQQLRLHPRQCRGGLGSRALLGIRDDGKGAHDFLLLSSGNC